MGISLGMAIARAAFSERRTVQLAELSRQGLDTSYAIKFAVTLAFHYVLILAIGIGCFVVVLSLIPERYT